MLCCAARGNDRRFVQVEGFLRSIAGLLIVMVGVVQEQPPPNRHLIRRTDRQLPLLRLATGRGTEIDERFRNGQRPKAIEMGGAESEI